MSSARMDARSRRRFGRPRVGSLSRWHGLAAAAVLLVAGVGAVAIWLATRPADDSAIPGTAVIVDQLSLTEPNPGFVSEATNLLTAAGYRVDYVPGELVNVDYYRTLPSKRYAVVIFRTHAATFKEADADHQFALLFTSEAFDVTRHTSELRDGRLAEAIYYEGAQPFFAITPDFIRDSTKGSFKGATVIMMGCNGLEYAGTAQAFLDRGATAFVSWDKQVTPGHTDLATEHVLQRVLVDGASLKSAVATANRDLGPDPAFGATLVVVGNTEFKLKMTGPSH